MADFLADYIKNILEPNWGNAEIAKPFAERHPIMQWYEGYCLYQQKTITQPGTIVSAEVTGVVGCYLGLAYSLYLLDHNVELQQRLIRRLKDRGQFQGAYYELMIASTLIKAGFDLVLEDEGDRASKHCEFSAVSKRTHKKYWVEAKMRGIQGLLGRTGNDGGSSRNPTDKMIRHLSRALQKPAPDERLIFIDLNEPLPPDCTPAKRPNFISHALKRLERYEQRELANGERAYVFVTCLDFHHKLDAKAQMLIAPFGLGIPDFNRSGHYALSEIYRREQAHIDAFSIAEAFSKLLEFPSTFDGSLPSAAFDGAPRIIIGEIYDFPAPDGSPGMTGRVTTACVVEAEKAAYIGVTTADGTSHILLKPLTDRELADYRAHPAAFFGEILPVSRRAETPYDMFRFLMDGYAALTRQQLLEKLKDCDSAELAGKSDDELRAIYCERLVSALPVSSSRDQPDGGAGSSQ